MKNLLLYKSNFFYRSNLFTVIIKTNLLKISPIWCYLINYNPKYKRVSTIKVLNNLKNKCKSHKIISRTLQVISSMLNIISIKSKIFSLNKASKALSIFLKKSSKMQSKFFLQMERITTVCPKFSDFSSCNILFFEIKSFFNFIERLN